MSEYCVYLKMPSYLRQWFIHRHGGNNPVNLIRGSIESKLLQRATIPMPHGIHCEDLSEASQELSHKYFTKKLGNIKNSCYLCTQEIPAHFPLEQCNTPGRIFFI